MPVAKRRPGPAVDGWAPGRFVQYEGAWLSRDVDCRWYGDVCVFPDGDRWAVATKGKLIVLRARTEADARSVAEIVAATLGADLRVRDGEELKRRFPAWFRAWGKAVNASGRYLDPGPYLDGAKS